MASREARQDLWVAVTGDLTPEQRELWGQLMVEIHELVIKPEMAALGIEYGTSIRYGREDPDG